MSILGKIFTWWDGATLGTALAVRTGGTRVGEDALGNVYFQARTNREPGGHLRRWVIYNGPNDASRVPPEWHGWLHHQVDDLPDRALPPVRAFEKAARPNATGTVGAYRPAGALESGGRRAAATGDYEAWSPDAA